MYKCPNCGNTKFLHIEISTRPQLGLKPKHLYDVLCHACDTISMDCEYCEICVEDNCDWDGLRFEEEPPKFVLD